jgi:hypothetical protein
LKSTGRWVPARREATKAIIFRIAVSLERPHLTWRATLATGNDKLRVLEQHPPNHLDVALLLFHV